MFVVVGRQAVEVHDAYCRSCWTLICCMGCAHLERTSALYALIELGREYLIRVMRKQPFYLTYSDSCRGELGDVLPTKERYLAGFQTWGGASSYEVTQEEGLVDMEQHGGMRMLVAIVQRD